MKRIILIISAMVALFVLSWAAARAQNNNYSLNWQTVDGGGSSSGGNYVMQSSSGQAGADTASGGSYNLYGGFWGFTQAETLPTVSLVLTPTNPPITIPPAGGSYQYDAQLANNSDSSQSFDAWITFAGPGGISATLGPLAITLQPGQSVGGTLTQQVPGAAPAGSYSHTAFVGTFPDVVIDSDSFTWEKAASAGSGSPLVTDWDTNFDEWLLNSP